MVVSLASRLFGIVVSIISLQRSVYIAPTTGSSKPDKSAKRLLAERHENEEK
jgi:hypothetical protein